MALGSRDGSACYCLIFPTPIWWFYPVLSPFMALSPPHSCLVVLPARLAILPSPISWLSSLLSGGPPHLCHSFPLLSPETTAAVSLTYRCSVSTKPATAKIRTGSNHTVSMIRHHSLNICEYAGNASPLFWRWDKKAWESSPLL